MKKLFALLILVFSVHSIHAQIGFKAGLNFANVSNASSINSSSRSGFHAGIFLGGGKGLIASRTELLFSRQGYDYKSGNTTGTVNLDYIMLPQLMGINVTKYLMLQLGVQMAYLLNAKVDSSSNTGGMSGTPYGKAMDYYNRFDYGFGAGAEVHPYKGLLIGAKYNIGLGKLYKDAQSGQMPSFSSIDAKNNLVQLYLGWRFGK